MHLARRRLIITLCLVWARKYITFINYFNVILFKKLIKCPTVDCKFVALVSVPPIKDKNVMGRRMLLHVRLYQVFLDERVKAFHDVQSVQYKDVSCKNDVVRKFEKFMAKHLFRSLEAWNFVKNETPAKAFLCEFIEILIVSANGCLWNYDLWVWRKKC